MTEQEQLEFVKHSGLSIDTMTEQEQLEMVKHRGLSIDIIKNPSLEVQLAAVQQT